MPLYIAKSGDLDRCYRCLTDSLTTLNDRATQLLIKYKSGALVTQYTHTRKYCGVKLLLQSHTLLNGDGTTGRQISQGTA